LEACSSPFLGRACRFLEHGRLGVFPTFRVFPPCAAAGHRVSNYWFVPRQEGIVCCSGERARNGLLGRQRYLFSVAGYCGERAWVDVHVYFPDVCRICCRCRFSVEIHSVAQCGALWADASENHEGFVRATNRQERNSRSLAPLGMTTREGAGRRKIAEWVVGRQVRLVVS